MNADTRIDNLYAEGEYGGTQRFLNVCERAGITTLGELAAYGVHRLYMVKNCGHRTVKEAREILKSAGLSFQNETPITLNRTVGTVPTEPGYYWHRDIDPGHGEAYEWEVLRLHRNGPDAFLFIYGSQASPGAFGGKWGSRIPDPEEKQEQDKEVTAMRALLAESEISLRPIRDNFAAFALNGILASGEYDTRRDRCAGEAYLLADAMMAEREKRN